MDPKSSPADNSDLLVERGPSSLVRRLGFATDIFWQPRFLFDDTGDITDFDFYQKPFQAAKNYRGVENTDLGYWSPSFRMDKNDVDIITYSVPLLGEDGLPYGVAGVELTTDYLRTLMSSDELLGSRKRRIFTGRLSRRGQYLRQCCFQRLRLQTDFR